MDTIGERFDNFAENIDDLAVVLNDDIDNLTVENVDITLPNFRI